MRKRDRHSPIAEYVATLAPALTAGPFLRRRVQREVAEHLRDASYRYRLEGLSESAAQARAVKEFGSEETLAAGFLDATREVKVMIRNSKIACVLGAALWFLGALSLGLHEFELDGGSAPDIRVPIPALIAGGVLLGVGMLGVHSHNKKAVPRLSFWAWLLLAIGFSLGGPFVWGLNAIGAPALLVGAILTGAATLRAGSLPRGAAWLLIAAAPAAAGVQALAATLEGDGTNLLSFAGPTAYMLSTLGGAIWLALAVPIASEEPVDGGPSPTVA